MVTWIFFFFLIPSILSAPQKTARIIDGRPASAGEFPFAASLTVSTINSRFQCGGSLLNHLNILTSAACVQGATEIHAILGVTNLTSTATGKVELTSTEYVAHEDYNPDTLVNDIALVHIRQTLTYSDYVRPAYLPYSVLESGEIVNAIGWGRTSDEGASTDELQSVDLVSLSNEECSNIYPGFITDNMLCVSGNDIEGTCTGDMGNGLIQVTFKIYWLVGVASFIADNNVCESAYPSGYTRVYPYASWISSNMRT